MAAAAQEANDIIDLRTFSWSDLFSQLEMTLPKNVRLTNFQPEEDRTGRLVVNLRVQARRVQDLESFIDALEKTGRFDEVLAAEEQTDPEGLINGLVRAVYLPASEEPAPEKQRRSHDLQETTVSDATQSVIQRVVAEHRRGVYALVAGIVINVLVFAFLVYPLQSDVANVEQRTRTAEAALAAAQADFARANGV